MTDSPAYGLWGLVLINSFVFILFAYSFFKPQTTRDWRSFSAFSASCRAFCGDVRLSAHHLFPLRLVAKPLSERRLVFPRRGPSAGDDVRLENQPTLSDLSIFLASRSSLQVSS
jgi:hypothetical protein